jgi:hypothetical protein
MSQQPHRDFEKYQWTTIRQICLVCDLKIAHQANFDETANTEFTCRLSNLRSN